MTPASDELSKAKKRFVRVTRVGVVLNLLFSLPLIFAPSWMLSLLGVPGEPVTWPQFFGVLLTILSGFYLVTVSDLDRYRRFAWANVASRACGVAFALTAVLGFGASDVFLLAVFLDGTIGFLQAAILGKVSRLEHGIPSKPAWKRIAASVLLVAAVFAAMGWHELFRSWPQEVSPDTMEEFFKHGSIGTEDAAGIPYWIWLVLPQVFPQHLPGPGGYSSLGFLWEAGDELPIGFTRKKIGFERVGINCALCHTSAYQVPGEARPRFHLGGPGNTVDVLEYQRFLFRCAADPGFESGTIMAAIGRQKRMSIVDRAIYRFLLVPMTRKALLKQAEAFRWTEEPFRPHWGRGRIEPFNPVKVAILDVPVGTTLGTSDMQPLWNLGSGTRPFHWDGLSTDLTEVVRSSALGDGATPDSTPLAHLDALQGWLATRRAPAWPFGPVDAELAEAGKKVFDDPARGDCARCHADGGKDLWSVLPPSETGTDPDRAAMWTRESAAAYNRYLGSRDWAFKSFRSTGGYVCGTLHGLWLRAPYLHNGSVPTLADLLAVPSERPPHFWRGSTAYDVDKVGFASQGDAAQRAGTPYDTKGRGNGNGGHAWGTTLPAGDKKALLEYLKTL